MKLDSNIYGADDTGAASAAASKALSAPMLVDPFEHGPASLGGGNDTSVSKAEARAKNNNTADDRACVKGNHGKQGCNE